jgi:hypothetical protein
MQGVTFGASYWFHNLEGVQESDTKRQINLELFCIKQLPISSIIVYGHQGCV